MATKRSALELTSSLQVVRDTDTDETAENDVFDGAVILYLVQADNSGNTSTPIYLKLYNNAAPTVGTTAPDIVLMIPAGATIKLSLGGGVSFGTAISMAAVTAAGTAGTVGPTSDVSVTLVAA